MDDTTKNPNDQLPMANDPKVGAATDVVQPQQDDAQQQPVQPQPAQQPAPTGSMHKEGESVGSQDVEYTMTPSDPAEMKPELDPEVERAGVELSASEELHLTQEHVALGITPAKESVPILSAQPVQPLIKNEPFTYSEANEIVKTAPTDDTRHWLAVLLIMLYKKMHLGT